MDRFSFVAPNARFSHFTISDIPEEDRLRLARSSFRPQKNGTHTSTHSLTAIPSYYGGEVEESEDRSSEQYKPVVWKPTVKFYLAFSALAALSLVVALDGTSISVALPTIAESLNGTSIEAFWAGTSFLLCSTAFLPVYAAFSNIFGRKQLTLLAVTLFFAGALMAGVAKNMGLMLVGRSVQGVGAGGVTAMTNILLTDLVPLRNRGNWIGVLGAVWAVGSVSGPIVGGTLAHPNSWPWIFWLNLPFIATSFILVALYIRLRAAETTFMQKILGADWLGSVFFVAGITAILIPITWGGVMYSWSSWRTIIPMAFGATGFIILAYHEKFVATEPIIRFPIFANRTANLAYFETAIHGMVLWCLLYYQPLYFEGVRGFKPVMAGVALFPATFTVAPMAIVSGLLITKYQHYRVAIWGGWAITTLGVGFMCATGPKTALVQLVMTDFLAGIGLGTLFPALQFQLQAASPASHMASAVAMFCFFRGLGQTLGIAIGGNIFQNSLRSKLAAQPMFASRAAEMAKDATALVQWMQNAPHSEALDIVRTAYTDSLRLVYIVMAGFALSAALCSLFVKHYTLDRGLETEQFLLEESQQQNASHGQA